MTIIANKCPDYKVTVVDISKERIDAWNSDKLPIFEPGLLERVLSVRGKNSSPSDRIEDSRYCLGRQNDGMILVCKTCFQCGEEQENVWRIQYEASLNSSISNGLFHAQRC